MVSTMNEWTGSLVTVALIASALAMGFVSVL